MEQNRGAAAKRVQVVMQTPDVRVVEYVLQPGETFMIPPGVVHRAGNAGDGASRYLLVQGVGRYDFVRAA